MGPEESRLNYIPPNRLGRSSTDAMEREVRERRHNIDDLFGELSSLVHPKTLMRQAVDWMRSGENRRGVKGKATEAGESLKESGRDMKRKISRQISNLTHDAKTASRDMLEKRRSQTQAGLQHAREGAVREMGQAKERAVATAHENPLVVALGFLGAGLVAGMILPHTRAERKIVRKAGAFGRETHPAADDVIGRDEMASA